jgi:exonuclease VII small subunit
MIHGAGKQIFAALVLIIASAPMAMAADGDKQRYSLTETAEGIIRLDKQTGQISICKINNSKLTCKLGADERLAYQSEIARIDAKLDKLQKRMTSLESGEFLKKKAKKSLAEAEQEFDQALKFADKAFRHFFNIMEQAKKKPKKDAI